MVVFLFLTSCNPNFNTNQKNVKYQPNKKRLNPNQEVNPKYHKISSDKLVVKGLFADLKLTKTGNSMPNDMKRCL